MKPAAYGSFTNYVDKILAFLTTFPPALTLSMVLTLTKSGHFWTNYLPRLVNVVCERPPTLKAAAFRGRVQGCCGSAK